jgi:RNA polymerase sigma-70 factor (ECF subfamily)
MLALDEQAFEQFTIEFGPRILAYFVHRGMAQSEAEDLAVSCVTDIALKVRDFADQGPGSLDRWVFTCAYHYFIDWLRKNPASERPVPELSDFPDFGSEIEPNSGVCQAVNEAVSQLAEVDQRIVALRDLEQQLSYCEIGQLLGLTPSHVRVRHHRALKRLQEILADHPAIKPRLEKPRSSDRDDTSHA